MFRELAADSFFCSFFLRLWQALLISYDESRLAKLVRGLSDRWKDLWHSSAIVRFLVERDGIFSRAWPDSRVCAALTWLVNLPANLLHWIYRRFQSLFDGSFFANLAFDLGDQVPAAAGWLILLLMNIPYEHWNNGYSLLGYLLLFVLAVAAGMRRGSLRMNVRAVGPYTVCFLLAVCLAWPLSYAPAESKRFLLYHLSCALCVLVVVSTVERADQLERLAGFGCLGMLGAAVYAVIQRIQGVAVNPSNVDLTLTLNTDMPGRVYSYYENPNAFAHLLVLLIPVGVALLFGARRRCYRAIGLVSAIVGCAALIMTYCRAAWGGLLVAAVVFVFLWNRKLLPLFLAAAIIAVPLLPSTVLNRILTVFDSNDKSIASRGSLYEAAIRLLRLRPVTGAGLGTTAVQNAIRDYKVYRGTAPFVHAHNTALQIWLETGLLGIAAFAASICHALKRGARLVLRPDAPRSVRMAVLGAVSGLCGSMVCGLADYIWNYPRVMLVFWFVAALLLAGIKLNRESAERS